MTDANLIFLRVEAEKKSGAIAALLNLFFPGFGYIYCGNWILGIFAFVVAITLWVVTLGIAILPVAFALVIDGLLCAKRYNKKLTNRLLAEHAAKATN